MNAIRVLVFFAAIVLMLPSDASAIDIYKALGQAQQREEEDFRNRWQRLEEERWRCMTPEERIAEELRRARLERERARDEEVQRRLYNQGHLPGTWLYWFRYGSR